MAAVIVRVVASSRRVRWVLAQLGRKPGAEGALAMLLTTHDLPGEGWKQIDERTWRTGEADDSASARRARKLGSVTAWRSFEDAGGSQWLWCQVTPLASASDAEAALTDLPSKMLKNLRGEARLVASRDITPPFIEHASHVWANEQETDGPAGRGAALFLAATVDGVVLIVAASGSELWSWDGVRAVAAIQAERVAQAVNQDGAGEHP